MSTKKMSRVSHTKKIRWGLSNNGKHNLYITDRREYLTLKIKFGKFCGKKKNYTK